MKEIDTIRESAGHIAQIFSEYPELTALKKLADSVESALDAPMVLSDIAIKMSINLIRVGSLVSKLGANSNDAYVIRKWRNLGEFHRMSGTVADRQAKANENTIEEQRHELINKYIHDIVKAYYDDYDRIIMVLQSRLKVLQSERING